MGYSTIAWNNVYPIITTYPSQVAIVDILHISCLPRHWCVPVCHCVIWTGHWLRKLALILFVCLFDPGLTFLDNFNYSKSFLNFWPKTIFAQNLCLYCSKSNSFKKHHWTIGQIKNKSSVKNLSISKVVRFWCKECVQSRDSRRMSYEKLAILNQESSYFPIILYFISPNVKLHTRHCKNGCISK